MEKLKNTGLVSMGEEHASMTDQATFVVLGLPRSGTSIISGVLHHLGVFMGRDAHPPVFEDKKMSAILRGGVWGEIDEVVSDYNEREAKWGFKRPDLLYDVSDLGMLGVCNRLTGKRSRINNLVSKSNFAGLHQRLRNPVYLVTFKDVLAIANRNKISLDIDIMESMNSVVASYGGLLALLEYVAPRALLISVDKILRDKEFFVDYLIDFCRLRPTAGQKETALEFITKDPKEYLDISRKNKSMGYLDEVGRNHIRGWARYLEDERVATVAMSIDGKEVARARADVFRPDLQKLGYHSSGNCGFCFNEFDVSLLRDGSEVSVRATEDIKDLVNSPARFAG